MNETTEADRAESGRTFAQNAMKLAHLDAEVAVITPPACPSWCEHPAGHVYRAGSTRLDDIWRLHTAHVSPSIDIEAYEVLENGGVVTLSPATVWCAEHGIDDYGPEQIEELAAELLRAAARCREIRDAQATA